MDEIFEELSSRIEERRLMLAALSEKCKELLKPWKCEDEIQVSKPAPADKEINTEEKQQLELIEKVLEKAVKIRTSHEQNEENQRKVKRDDSKLHIKTRLGSTSQSMDSKSTIPLSQLCSIQAPSLKNKVKPPQARLSTPENKAINLGTSKSPRKKSVFRPAHMSAPYKTFAQFKFPAQRRNITKPVTKRDASASAINHKEAQKSARDQPMARQEADSSPVEYSKILPNSERKSEKDGEVVPDVHDIRVEGETRPGPTYVSLSDIGGYLRMPPRYSCLKAQNNNLREKVAKVCAEAGNPAKQSNQNKFAQALESHMAASRNQEVKDLFMSYDILQHYRSLLHLCNTVGRLKFSEKTSILDLHQMRQFVSTIINEFRSLSGTAENLIKRGKILSAQSGDGHFVGSCLSKPDDFFMAGSSGGAPVVRYRDLRQLDEYQSHYEHLISLRQQRIVLELVRPFIEHLKAAPAGSENSRQMYRSLYSLVHSNGRLVPAIIGDVNEDLFGVAEDGL